MATPFDKTIRACHGQDRNASIQIDVFLTLKGYFQPKLSE